MRVCDKCVYCTCFRGDGCVGVVCLRRAFVLPVQMLDQTSTARTAYVLDQFARLDKNSVFDETVNIGRRGRNYVWRMIPANRFVFASR